MFVMGEQEESIEIVKILPCKRFRSNTALYFCPVVKHLQNTSLAIRKPYNTTFLKYPFLKLIDNQAIMPTLA